MRISSLLIKLAARHPVAANKESFGAWRPARRSHIQKHGVSPKDLSLPNLHRLSRPC